MPRIKLEPLSAYRFRTSLAVRVTDVNYGGHLANNAVAGLLHQARVEVLRELNVSETDLGDGGTGLIMTDLAVVFGAEAFMLDPLTVFSEFVEIRSSSFRMAHAVRRAEDLIVLAEMGFAGYSYQRRRVVPLPKPFLASIQPPA